MSAVPYNVIPMPDSGKDAQPVSAAPTVEEEGIGHE